MLRIKIQRVFLLLLICQSAIFANATEPKETTVTCNVPNYSGSAVALYQVENGQASKMGFRFPDKQDTIQFSFPLEKEGAYFIQRVGKGEMYNHVIYLQPGDNKVVDIFNHSASDFDCNVV